MRDDNTWMELVKNGDKQAYNELVKKYRIPAISFAYNLLHDFQLAEDAVQDVFVSIYIKRASYRPIYQFKTFLYQAIRNKCIDYLRKSKKHASANMDSITELLKTSSAEERYLAFENNRQLLSFMDSLKKDYKTALYLFAVEGASYTEIARIMNKTVPQVKILIFRARKKLKKRFGEGFTNEG